MRSKRDWSRPARPTEREVLKAIDEAVQKATMIGMPITVCAIKPSDENRIVRTVVRGSKETEGVPSTEDLAYLASTTLFDCTSSVPDEARPMLTNLIVEFAEEMRYSHRGGPIPPHMLERDEAPGFMGEGEPS